MTIAIVSDSTCDLPPEMVAAHNITVLPLYINVGERGYRDGIDLTRQEFYTRLPRFHPHPTTAAPGESVFSETYKRLAAAGAEAILSIHIAESLSATVNVARSAASAADAPVTVIDSGQLSLGVGFQVLAAARAARDGLDPAEITAHLADLSRRTHVFARIDTLDYLRRSGRMNGVVAGLGSILRIKPILKMNRGVATSERVRTRSGANRRLIDLLEGLGPLAEAALLHSNAEEAAADLGQQAAHLLPENPLLAVNITPVIGAHIGPGAVGFACVQAHPGGP